MLHDGRAKLENIVRSRAQEAVNSNDHSTVIRYIRLHKPLRLQQEGMEILVSYLRDLISERAKADYEALVDAAGGTGISCAAE